MRVTKLHIKNYKSFSPKAEPISFNTAHSILVGRNNAGKSNILSALDIVFGPKSPAYLRLPPDDFNDVSRSVEIDVTLGGITTEAEKGELYGLPNLAKKHRGALYSKKPEQVEIVLSYRYTIEDGGEVPGKETEGDEAEEEEPKQEERRFQISLWGFRVFRKQEDVRRYLIRMIKVPAVRDAADELSGSRWTSYGRLMQSVLEDSPQFGDVSTSLKQLNDQIEQIFAEQKKHLVAGAQVVSYVDDVDFQLTKEGNPTELLRNLEIFITEKGRKSNIQNMGTGTQSAIIIGIFELALKNRSSKSRLFCIEEPEVFIHPHGIRYLGDLLRKISADGKTQVIVSSHAPALVATFSPPEIIRVDKTEGASKVFQPSRGSLKETEFRRFINPENSEMFFSDRVLLVEGDVEKQILPVLGKMTPIDPKYHKKGSCDFDRANIGVVKLDGKENLLTYLQILGGFRIPCLALVDKDFLASPRLKQVCDYLGIKESEEEKLIRGLADKGVLVNGRGEFEDLIPDNDIVEMRFGWLCEENKIPAEKHEELRKSLLREVTEKKGKARKTSDALKVLFGGVSKTTYAIRIADYYAFRGKHPLEGLVRGLFGFNSKSIIF